MREEMATSQSNTVARSALTMWCAALISHQPYGELAGAHDTSKYEAIPNDCHLALAPCLTNLLNASGIDCSCRRWTIQRLSPLFGFGACVKQDPVAKDWLPVSGAAVMTATYEHIIRNNISWCNFQGRQILFLLCKEASIFRWLEKARVGISSLTEGATDGRKAHSLWYLAPITWNYYRQKMKKWLLMRVMDMYAEWWQLMRIICCVRMARRCHPITQRFLWKRYSGNVRETDIQYRTSTKL